MLMVFSDARAGTYQLDIDYKNVNITGADVRKIVINGIIPGPTLRFKEGEVVEINVTNHLEEVTSLHWHGLLLPGEMDGAPGFNGFEGIKPGETFTYRFKIRQNGTYWYHSHSAGQEQDGLYGAIVIAPYEKEKIEYERDYVIVLSDFHNDDASEIMRNLKISAEYYQNSIRTIGDFFEDVKKQGFAKTWEDRSMWGKMRMMPTDLSDVTGYTFLINGKTLEQNWTALYNGGEKIKLRFVNASATTFYDIRIPGLKMTVVAADGQNVEPVEIDEFRFGTAETYDVIIQPRDYKTYTLVAESIDRDGFALATIATKDGQKGEAAVHRKRALLTMEDMGMGHQTSMESTGVDHGEMGHKMPAGIKMDQTSMKTGWANNMSPTGRKTLDYSDLRFLGTQPDTRSPGRDIEIRIGGNMERYIWTINGKQYHEAEPIYLNCGERVRLKFINETMMAHPMHLHGMFMQIENGQSTQKLPNKHVIIVPPGQTYSALLSADEIGEWPFHCHMLYHMMSGMMRKVVVLDPGNYTAQSKY